MMALIFSDILLVFSFTFIFVLFAAIIAFVVYKKYAPAGWNVKTGICYTFIVLASIFLSIPVFGLIRVKSHIYKAQHVCEVLVVDYIQNNMQQTQVGNIQTRLITGNPEIDAYILPVVDSGNKLFDFRDIIIEKYSYLDRFIPQVTLEDILLKAEVEITEITSLDSLAKLVSNYCFAAIHDMVNGYIFTLVLIYLLFTGLLAYVMYRDIKKKQAFMTPDVI